PMCGPRSSIRSSRPRSVASVLAWLCATASWRSTRASSTSRAPKAGAPPGPVSCRSPGDGAPCAQNGPPAVRSGRRVVDTMPARILIADDEDSLRWVLEKGLRGVGYDVTSVKDGEESVRVFEAQPFDLVFLDVRMPGLDGLTALERIRDLRPDAYVVVMTAHGSMDTAIKAMQRGAYDYLNKPFDLDEVLLLSERALAASRLTQEVARLRTGLAEVREFSALIGRHPRMQDVYKT